MLKELVDEDGVFRLLRNLNVEVVLEFGSVVHHGHGAATQHIAGPHNHGVGDALGHSQGVFKAHGRAVRRLKQLKLFNQGLEALAVFGAVNGIGARAQNGHASAHERHGKVQRGLAAKLHNNALWLFPFHNVHHVLKGQGLKVEPVRGVVVCGNGFGVRVGHDCHHARVAQGKRGVAAAVVKLNALTNAVGAAAKNEHLAAVFNLDFVATLVGGVEIRGVGFKFGRAGIHQIVGGLHVHFLAHAANVGLGHLPHFCQLAVGESVFLGFAQHVGQRLVGSGHVVGKAKVADALFHFNNVAHLADKPGVDGRNRKNLFFADTGHKGLTQRKHAPRVGAVQ